MREEANNAADALGATMSVRDADAIRSIYANDIVVWHASTGAAQTKEENAGLVAAVFSITSRLEYRDSGATRSMAALSSNTGWSAHSATGVQCHISTPVS